MASPFSPRLTFANLSSIPRSYFLGHHAAGLSRMKSLLSTIDLVIECRDYRTPLCSRNPLFEQDLGQRSRLIVYTKQDLGSNHTPADQVREKMIGKWFAPTPTIFCSTKENSTISAILAFARAHTSKAPTAHLFGTRLLIVGIPNVGKSSLLNSLRNLSLHKRKAARTGDQPGITRKIGTAVKIIEDTTIAGEAGNVYVLDTPGVFVPYVPDAETMLKLALCGNVKDTIIPPTTVADYLLFHLNLRDPGVYANYSAPTNDVYVLLDGLARKHGRLKKGGEVDFESSALQLIQKWRAGELGKFVLDEVTEDGLSERNDAVELVGGSVSQARKVQRRLRREAGAKKASDG